MKLLLIMLIGLTAQCAVNNTGGGLGYSCSKEIGSIGKCTCDGAADCLLLGMSSNCSGDIVVLECDLPPSAKCSCEWNQKVSGGSVLLGKDTFRLKAIMP